MLVRAYLLCSLAAKACANVIHRALGPPLYCAAEIEKADSEESNTHPEKDAQWPVREGQVRGEPCTQNNEMGVGWKKVHS